MRKLDNLYVSDLEFEDSGMRGPKGESGDAPSAHINKVAPYLYTIECTDIDYDKGEVFVRKHYPEPDTGCTAIAKTEPLIFGHNYDAQYDETAEFVVRTSARKGRHASIAMCAIQGVLTADVVDSETESDFAKESYDVLPLFAIDGVNDCGLAVAVNRMPTSDEDDLSDDTGMCSLFAARYILDNADSVDSAIELLKEKDFWFSENDAIKHGFYLLISDKTKAVISDLNGNNFSDKTSIYPDVLSLTNFRRIGWDGTNDTLEQYANGLERFNITLSAYDSISNSDDLYDVLKSLWYSNVYNSDNENIWYSDYNGDWTEVGFGELTIDSAQEDYDPVIEYCASLFEERSRDGATMHTMHTALYDIENLMLSLYVQEEDKVYRFCMDEINLIFDEAERAKAAEQAIRDDFAGMFYYKPEVDDALHNLNDTITEAVANEYYNKTEVDELHTELHNTITEETDNKLLTKANRPQNDGDVGQVLYRTEDGSEWNNLPKKMPEVTEDDNGKVMTVENGEWIASDKFADYFRYVNVTVAINSDNGGVPTGGILVTIKDGSTGDVVNEATYEGQPVSFRIPKDMYYIIEQTGRWEGYHNPTPDRIEGAATADASYVFTYEAIKVPNTLRELQIIVDSGNASTLRNHIGLQFDDVFNLDGTEYDIIWDLKDVENVYDEDGNVHTGVILEWHNATPFAMQFDAAERQPVDLETEKYAEDGVYYYSATGSTYRLLQLEAGDPLPTTYDGLYKNSIMSQDASIIRRGYGDYAESAPRKWLNSDGGIGQWWSASHIGDMPPENAATMSGFISGCSEQLLSMVKPIRITTALYGGEYSNVYDRFFIPSVSQINGITNLQEGDAWDDWIVATGSDTPTNSANSGREIIAVDGNTPQVIGLRTANTGYQYISWNIKNDGSLDGYTAATSQRRYTPCCAIY